MRNGARIVAGDRPAPELGPLFQRATVVVDIEDGAALVDEAQFGPVILVPKYTALNPQVPFGGAKASGYGHEFGVHGTRMSQ